MTDERRVEVAAEAILASELLGCGCCATSTPTPTCACGRTEADLDWTSCPSCGQYPQDEARSDIIARAVVAALDAHDGDLRERLAGAVEASARVDAGAPWVSGLHIAARIIRERP